MDRGGAVGRAGGVAALMLVSFLPAHTPAWLRIGLEVGALLLAARFLLGALRRGRIGTLALVAAAWMWFFWPPGHLWMLDAWRTVLADARGLVPALLGQAKATASQAGRALAAAGSAQGSSAGGTGAGGGA